MNSQKINEIISNFKDTTFDVFCGMLEMKTQTEIAEETGLNIKQVKYHVGLIYRAFDIDTCNAETHSKRLLFTRTFVEARPKYGLQDALNADQ